MILILGLLLLCLRHVFSYWTYAATQIWPQYVSYQERSCLVYAWKVYSVTDLIRDGHTQFVCVGAISWRFGRLVAGCQRQFYSAETCSSEMELKTCVENN